MTNTLTRVTQVKVPTLSDVNVLLGVVLSFLLRHFVPSYPIAFIPPAAVLLGLALTIPKLSQARLPLLVLAFASIVTSLLRPVPWVNDWPLDLYLLAGACLLLLRRNGQVDLGMKWSFRFSRLEVLSAIFITLISVAVLTVYFLNNRDVAKAFPLPELPTWSLPLVIVGVAIINALREELVYRVVLQRTFQASLSVFWAVVVQALAFGFFTSKTDFLRVGSAWGSHSFLGLRPEFSFCGRGPSRSFG